MDSCAIELILKSQLQGLGSVPFQLDVDLRLPGKGVTAIFGSSGSGKTTLLRFVAGLEKSQPARVVVNGTTWQDRQNFLPTHKRRLGYVFQEASLLPHMSAKKNIDYALKRSNKELPNGMYERVINLMGVESVLSRYPEQLSGGERQRIAITRALLMQPSLLLMDEPLAALDVARKREILPYLERLRDTFNIPILYVSHSVDEVSRLANYMVVLDEGKVTAQGDAKGIINELGLTLPLEGEVGALIEAVVASKDSQWHLSCLTFGNVRLWVRDNGDAIGKKVRLRILAKDISLAINEPSDSSVLNRLETKVVDIEPSPDPAMSLVRLRAGDEILIARITRRSEAQLGLSPGMVIWALIKSVAIVR